MRRKIMRKRMNVMYLNANMEGVRQIALKNFKEIYENIIDDLKGLEYIDLKKDKNDFPEFWIKVFDVAELIKKYNGLVK